MATRDEIISAAGAPLALTEPGKLDESAKPRSIMQAQALALRAQFVSAAKIVTTLSQRSDIPADVGMMLECLATQFGAGAAQCDSFLAMGEAMMSLARPALPASPPKTFMGAKGDG